MIPMHNKAGENWSTEWSSMATEGSGEKPNGGNFIMKWATWQYLNAGCLTTRNETQPDIMSLLIWHNKTAQGLTDEVEWRAYRGSLYYSLYFYMLFPLSYLFILNCGK